MRQVLAEILEIGKLSLSIVGMKLRVPKEVLDAASAGQCSHIKVPGDDARLLRRPISMMSKKDGLLHLAIQPKGKGTQSIVALRPGDSLDMIFPFGKGFDAKDAKEIWLVGGGLGVAPLQCCAEEFLSAGRRAYFGFRNKDEVYAAKACEAAGCAVNVCTDDGSAGEHGLVTAPLLRDLQTSKPDIIMACGPAPMLRAVQKIAAGHGIPLQVSLEQRMGCGIGACLTCSCETAWGGYARVCADGPVFDGEDVKL